MVLALTLMKGDNVVEPRKGRPDLMLLIRKWDRYLGIKKVFVVKPF